MGGSCRALTHVILAFTMLRHVRSRDFEIHRRCLLIGIRQPAVADDSPSTQETSQISEHCRRKVTPKPHSSICQLPKPKPKPRTILPAMWVNLLCPHIFSRAHRCVRFQGMSPSLKRARKPFLTRNLLTGGVIAAFAAGTFWYSIAAVQQDDFVSSTFPNPG